MSVIRSLLVCLMGILLTKCGNQQSVALFGMYALSVEADVVGEGEGVVVDTFSVEVEATEAVVVDTDFAATFNTK